MDSDILKILNEELLELKNLSRLAQQRLDLQHEELNKHTEVLESHKEILNQHKAGFDIMFRNMQAMEERMELELKRLRPKE